MRRWRRWRARRHFLAGERVTERMRRRDGTPVYQGEAWRWRELDARTWCLLIRYRPRRLAALLYASLQVWATVPGDHWTNVACQREGEVLAVKRDHVLMLVWSKEWARRSALGHVVGPMFMAAYGHGPHVERIPRDLPGWWRAA